MRFEPKGVDREGRGVLNGLRVPSFFDVMRCGLSSGCMDASPGSIKKQSVLVKIQSRLGQKIRAPWVAGSPLGTSTAFVPTLVL